jgi:hypothetical protein
MDGLNASLAPWQGTLVVCTGEEECVAASGGAVASAGIVKCTLLAGVADGRYCTCNPFRTGPSCSEPQPPLVALGATYLPLSLLLVRAIWLALCDLRLCPPQLRSSPGAVCLVLNTCTSLCGAVAYGMVFALRVSDGPLNTIATLWQVSLLALILMVNLLMLFVALVFESVHAIANGLKMHSKAAYLCMLLLVVVEYSALLLVKLTTQKVLVICAIAMIVAGLWLRATVRMSRTLESFGQSWQDEGGHNGRSDKILEKARASRRLVAFAGRHAVLALICSAAIALAPVTVLSSAPLVLVSWTCEWTVHCCIVRVVCRLGDYLGDPFRQGARRNTRRKDRASAAKVAASAASRSTAAQGKPQPSATSSLSPSVHEAAQRGSAVPSHSTG